MRSHYGLVLVIISVVVLITGSTVAGQTNISLWYGIGGAASEELTRLMDEFNASQKDIVVEYSRYSGYAPLMEKLKTAWAGGAAPNIAMLEQARAFEMVDMGALIPLNDYINNDRTITMEDIHPSMRSTVTYRGRVYGFPFNPSTPLVYFNKDLFQASGLPAIAPKTWNEILAQSRKLTRDTNGDGKPETYGYSFYAWGWLFEAWIGQNGGRVHNDDLTTFSVNSKPVIEAMQFTQSLVHEQRVAYYGSASSVDNLLYNGNLGVAERSSSVLFDMIGKAANIDLGVAPLACNKQCYVPIGGGNFVMLKTGSKADQDASWKFLSWLVQPENLGRFAAASGYLVSRRSAISSTAIRSQFAKEPRAKVSYDQLDSAYARPQVPFWGEVAAKLAQLSKVQFVENGNFQPILDDMNKQGNMLLQEWRSHN